MELSLEKNEMLKYIGRQMDNFYPDGYHLQGRDVEIAFDLALQRLEYCFQHISFPAYCDEKGQTHFSHLHADQYAQFLYYFSNSLWKTSENKVLCDKMLQLNKTLNSIFMSYKGKFPDIFFLGHPLGTILGNADYSDFLVVFQNVTVNTSVDAEGNSAPHLGKGLFLGAGAKIIGNKTVGDRVSIGVDALIYDEEVGNDKVVLRDRDGKVQVLDRKKEKCMAQNYFNVDIETFHK